MLIILGESNHRTFETYNYAADIHLTYFYVFGAGFMNGYGYGGGSVFGCGNNQYQRFYKDLYKGNQNYTDNRCILFGYGNSYLLWTEV